MQQSGAPELGAIRNKHSRFSSKDRSDLGVPRATGIASEWQKSWKYKQIERDGANGVTNPIFYEKEGSIKGRGWMRGSTSGRRRSGRGGCFLWHIYLVEWLVTLSPPFE